MREIPLSRCEYNFVTDLLKKGKRVDGRSLQDFRGITISYKLDYGCCIVDIGKTKVMAQVSAEMDRPKESRPHEGNIGIFVEMSTMASPSFDPAKPGEFGVELQRLLERSIIFSKAVDFEELCVRVGEQAWNISLHIHILSHDGNILDCASIAAVAALSHFKRPDVTVIGKEVKVHTLDEKNPVPLTFNHKPFCISFSFFDNGTIIVNDPTKLEENCCDGKLVVAVNKHREVCCTQMSGSIQVNSDQVLKCVKIATRKSKELTELVKKSLENDEEAKKANLKSSTTSSQSMTPTGSVPDPTLHIANSETKTVQVVEENVEMKENIEKSPKKEDKLDWVIKNAENTFTAKESSLSDTENMEDVTVDSDDDEEEETRTLQL